MAFLVNGVITHLKVDSGADANVISLENYNAIAKGDKRLGPPREVGNWKLLDFNGNEIGCAGQVTTTIAASAEGKRLVETFFVATSRSQSVLSYETATKLGVLVMNKTILQLEAGETFPSIPMEPIQLEIDTNVQPRVCVYNSIPAALESFVDEHWDELERQGIIEPLQGAPRWLSRVDVVPKKDGTYRVIIDMRPANKAIRRRYYQMPNPDHTTTRVRFAKRFSKYDFTSAYFHVLLHPASRYITAFMTSKGPRQFTRLPFGINCAPEIFQQVMDHLFGGLPGVIVYLDDLLVFAPDQETLKERCEMVMEVIKENNLTLNEGKCIHDVAEIEFLGAILSESGCKPAPERIDGITNFPKPQTYAQLREFIGLVNYIAKHLYNISTTMEPMRRLLEGNTKELKGARCLDNWSPDQDQAFRATKEQVANNILERGYFDPKHPTSITTDASPVGLAAIVTQNDPKNGEERVIACTSRSLTKTERKYPQTQREAKAIAWSIPKFDFYLIGIRFTLITDHEPMKFIFGRNARNLNKRALNRAENYALTLSQYEFDVEIIRSKQNMADCLSRCPAPITAADRDKRNNRNNGTAVIGSLTVTDEIRKGACLSLKEIAEATATDVQLQEVVKALADEIDWKEIPDFSRFKDELHLADGIIWRLGRAIVPQQLRKKAMGVAHRSHPGMSTTKHLLRKFVWWPMIDRHVEEFIKTCDTCIKLSASDPPEPLVMSSFPEEPWQDIALDFWSGSETDKKVLVIADYHSRAIRAEVLRETTSEATIKALEKVFGEWGWPSTMKHDNGPQLVSNEFLSWLEANGIESRPTTARNAQENGLVERHMKGITRAFAIAKIEKRNAEETLKQYVADYNSWPHSVTRVAPRDVLAGRVVKTRLPLQRMEENDESSNIKAQIRKRDQKFKIKKKTAEDARRRAKFSTLKVGDQVYLRDHEQRNKIDQRFLDTKHEITARSGGRLTLKSLLDNSIKIRKTVDVKLVPENLHDGSGAPKTEPQGMAAKPTAPLEATKQQDPDHAGSTAGRPLRVKKIPARLLLEAQKEGAPEQGKFD